jgi:hypothetical protein
MLRIIKIVITVFSSSRHHPMLCFPTFRLTEAGKSLCNVNRFALKQGMCVVLCIRTSHKHTICYTMYSVENKTAIEFQNFIFEVLSPFFHFGFQIFYFGSLLWQYFFSTITIGTGTTGTLYQ